MIAFKWLVITVLAIALGNALVWGLLIWCVFLHGPMGWWPWAIMMVIVVFPLIAITFDVLTNQYKRELNENSKGT